MKRIIFSSITVVMLIFMMLPPTPVSAAIHETLEGYTQEPSAHWTTGAVKGWAEGDCIPFRYIVENTGDDPVSLNLTLAFDHIHANGTIGIVDFEDFDIPAGIITGPTLDGIGFYYWDVTIPPDTTYVLEWCARLSNEAGLWGGAKMHVSADGKDVPIQVASIRMPALYATKSENETCDAISYTINYGNNGDADQSNTTLVDDYDETKVEVTDAGGGINNGDTITWDIGILAAGATGSKSYTVSIKGGVANGAAIVNSGNITGDLAEEDYTDNAYSVTSYAKVSPTADASSNSPVYAGDTIELYGGPSGMASYYWTGPNSFNSTLQNPTIPNATMAMAGTYTLIVTNENGCTDSDDVVVTITARALEITADSDSKVYDGTPLTDSGYSITSGTLAAGHTLDSVTVTGSQTEVGSSANVPSNAVILDGVVDVTANYDITYVNGTLTVTKRTLEITADSDSKVYDGTPLTNSGYSITSGALAAGDTLDSVVVTGSQTEVGSSANVPSNAVILDGVVDVTANYDITYVNGTLTVTKRALEITADSDSKVYDGTPLTDSGYSITSGTLAAGDTLDSVTVTGSQTEVGSSANVPSNAVILDGVVDVTANYDITYVNGTLTVTKRALEITAASDSKVYDGTPLTNSGYSITSGTLAAGDTLDSVTVTGSQTEVGSSANVPSNAVILDGVVDVTANYDITYVNGTLTVTKRALEITAASDSKVYDGTPLTNSGYSITSGALAAGDTLDSVVVTGSQTEVGSSANVPSAAVIKDASEVDVTASYNITYVNGTLTVTKRALEITAASDSKVYDGTALTNSNYSITSGALAAGHTLISVNVTGSQTEVGSSANVPSAAVIKDAGEVDVTASYNITYVNGTLTVTKRALEITAASDSKVYDGTALTNSNYSITSGALAAGDTLVSVNVTGSQTEVGSSANVPSAAVIKDAGEVDVTASYNIIYVNGTLTVTAPPPPPPPRRGGGGCPELKDLTVDWEENITSKTLYANNQLAVELLGPSPDGIHSLFLEQGTHAPIVDGETYYLIVIRELEETEIPALPEDYVGLVVFNITPDGAVFDRDIFLTLGLDELQLPENIIEGTITMAYYDDISGTWVEMEFEAGGPPNSVAELSLSAAITHFSIFGVLAELEPISPPPPANFVAGDLSIEPSVEKIWETVTFVTKTGESVTITANVVNDGGQEGTYTVVLKLNGETVETKTVTLGVGQSQQVSFTVSGLDYGQYEVEVAGLSDEFTTSRAITWWLIIVLIVALGLIIWGVVWGRRRRRRATYEG